MNIDLGQYVIPTIAAIVYLVCYLIGLWMENKEVKKKAIPTIAAALGIVLSFIFHSGESILDIILIGLVSGLSTTGFDQAIKLFKSEDKTV